MNEFEPVPNAPSKNALRETSSISSSQPGHSTRSSPSPSSPRVQFHVPQPTTDSPEPSPSSVSSDFAQLYRDNYGFVARVLTRFGMSTDTRDDAIQEVFLVAYRKMHTIAPGVAFRSWLYGVCRRVAASIRRGRSRHERRIVQAPTAPSPSTPEEDYQRVEAVQLVQHFLEKMDPKFRDIFVLADIEGLSAPEIAQALDMNANTVRSRLHTARKQFEKHLERSRARDDGPSSAIQSDTTKNPNAKGRNHD